VGRCPRRWFSRGEEMPYICWVHSSAGRQWLVLLPYRFLPSPRAANVTGRRRQLWRLKMAFVPGTDAAGSMVLRVFILFKTWYFSGYNAVKRGEIFETGTEFWRRKLRPRWNSRDKAKTIMLASRPAKTDILASRSKSRPTFWLWDRAETFGFEAQTKPRDHWPDLQKYFTIYHKIILSLS